MDRRVLRREGESFLDYKERLFRNQSNYKVTWETIRDALSKECSAEHTRKISYGYLERIEDEKRQEGFDKSVMIINDIHCPYERSDVLEIITRHAHEITHLVIGGDLMDCESISSFPKVTRMSLNQELVYTYEFIKKIKKILNNNQKIIIINGNHEERLYTMIKKMHEKELQTFINPNIINMIIDGFELFDANGKKKKYQGLGEDGRISYIPHWYVNIEDRIIVSHPKDFSQVDGKMCENIATHFLNKHEDFEVLVFAHTHKYSQMKVSRRQGAYVVENGCLCQPHSYSDVGKLGYSPQEYCYTIIKYNNNDKINYNNIKVYHLDEIEEYDKREDYKVKL